MIPPCNFKWLQNAGCVCDAITSPVIMCECSIMNTQQGSGLNTHKSPFIPSGRVAQFVSIDADWEAGERGRMFAPLESGFPQGHSLKRRGLERQEKEV